MNLSPEVAALLRKALNDAEYFRCGDDLHAAYAELAEAVGNLLTPLPAPRPIAEMWARHLDSLNDDDVAVWPGYVGK